MQQMTLKRAVVRTGVVMVAGLGLLLAGCMNVPAKLKEAAKAAEAGKWLEAKEITDKCLKKERANVTALVLNGIALKELSRNEDAARQLEQASTLAVDDYYAQYYCGWVLSELGRYEDALTPLRRAYEIRKPASQDLLVLLSRCCMEKNLPEGAKYLQQLRRFPAMEASPDLYNGLGVLWLNQTPAQYDQAAKNFNLAWQKDPKNVIAPQNLAVLYDQHNHNAMEALKYYRFCSNRYVELGDSLRASHINDRIALLEKEVAKPAPVVTPEVKTPTDAATSATGATKPADGKKGTAATPAVKPNKTPLKPAKPSNTKAGSKTSTHTKPAATKKPVAH